MTATDTNHDAPKPKAKARPKKKAVAKKAASPKPATKRSGLSDVWKRILRELGKAGAEGMSSVDLVKLCQKHDAGPWWGRHIRSGLVARVERGKFKLTAAGKRLAEILILHLARTHQGRAFGSALFLSLGFLSLPLRRHGPDGPRWYGPSWHVTV